MRRKIAGFICLLLAVFCITSCGINKKTNPSGDHSTQGMETQERENRETKSKEMETDEIETRETETEEEKIIKVFQSRKEAEDCEVTDCVLVKESDYHLVGVVQYTDEEENPCNLAFVFADGVCIPLGLDADHRSVIAEDSKLTCSKKDTVSLSLAEKETGKIQDYEVMYSKIGVANSNFKVITMER